MRERNSLRDQNEVLRRHIVALQQQISKLKIAAWNKMANT
jgi:hypothetical protein